MQRVTLLGLLVSALCAASAHAPVFSDRKLWPDLTGKEAFVTETWPTVRVLVWAKTDLLVDDKQPWNCKGASFMDPANWLENGKPAGSIPDKNTDVVFPSRPDGKLYGITFHTGQSDPNQEALTCRHLTVEANVGVDNPDATVFGNIWIKEGGRFGAGPTYPRGKKHTFLRNDNRQLALEAQGKAKLLGVNPWVYEEGKNARAAFGQMLVIQKPGASIEILGFLWSQDELKIDAGTLIIGPKARVEAGDRSYQIIEKGAELVLMSGAWFGKRSNQSWYDDTVVKGVLRAGTTERPLTSDATLALSFKIPDDAIPIAYHSGCSLMVPADGRIEVVSSDPAKARLVVRNLGYSGTEGGTMQMFTERELDQDKLVRAITGHPRFRKITGVVLGSIAGPVLFDDVAYGGFEVADPATFLAQTNVAWGKGCAGHPEQLLVRYSGRAVPTLEEPGGEQYRLMQNRFKKP